VTEDARDQRSDRHPQAESLARTIEFQIPISRRGVLGIEVL
jgi:hypothetical protein